MGSHDEISIEDHSDDADDLARIPLAEREAELAEQLRKAEREVAACTEVLARARRALDSARGRRDEAAEKLDRLRASRDKTAEPGQWRTSQPWTQGLKRMCEEYFGVTEFRSNQEETLNALFSCRDVLLVAPTGAGKSLCFQAPAIFRQSLTLVISPLLSLMHDQVMSLRVLGVAAAMLSSGESREAQANVRAELKSLAPAKSKGPTAPKKDGLRVLYVTPERIAKSKQLMSTLEQIYAAGQLGLIAVDEAHCISHWGHDFRPDYEKLAALKVQFPKTAILALTATATGTVASDIQKCLGIRAVEFRSPTDRPNLFYAVRQRPKAPDRVLSAVAEVIHRFPPGTPGIVYCFTRKDAESLWKGLIGLEVPVPCAYYHGDLDADSRQRVHSSWVEGKVSVVIATVAFGMGINKSDVRFVIHAGLPASLHHYYQEAGRAGRDGQPALCLIFYRPADVPRHSVMDYWKPASLRELYTMAMYCQDSTCRRKQISEHFGEQASPCDGACDLCFEARNNPKCGIRPPTLEGEARPSKKTRQGGGPYLTALRFVADASEADESLTLLKLCERLAKESCLRGEVALENASYVVLALLGTGYLREEFKHSPYSTNAYLVLTTEGQRALDGGTGVDAATRRLGEPPELLRSAPALGPVGAAAKALAIIRQGGAVNSTGQSPVLARRLRKLRTSLGVARNVPGLFVLTDSEVAALAALCPPWPASPQELRMLPVVKRRLYGADVLHCLREGNTGNITSA